MSAQTAPPSIAMNGAGAIDPFKVSGTLTAKQLRKFVNAARTGHVGPTAVYYAGVTAPAIAAGMATIVGATLDMAGWQAADNFMLSSLVAAMAGISWYLIFMRWAYRHTYGREAEREHPVEFEANEFGISWQRGSVTSRVGWSAVSEIKVKREFILLSIIDGDDIMMPLGWFDNRKDMHGAAAHLEAVRDRSETLLEAA